MATKTRIPVILDTDIGDDIDDTWALAMALKCPELDVKLVVSDVGETVYRAKIIAKMLQVAGRTDVDVGIGVRQTARRKPRRQTAWVQDYRLSRYRGRIHEDGVGAIIRTIMESREPVTLICIGPMPNIREALKREPRIGQKARFVGMHGSLDWSFMADHAPVAEYNVKVDVPACQAVFTAPWDKTITPLDTCGKVVLRGKKFAAVAASKDPLARAVIENYRVWRKSGRLPDDVGESSILFDCVAIHLAFSTRFLTMKRMGVRVRDDGFTVRDPKAPKINCALAWADMAGFEDSLVERLTG